VFFIRRRRTPSFTPFARRSLTSTLFGASSIEQLEEAVGALDRLDFSSDELTEIDRHAIDSGINIWAASSEV
jgi:L-glyceraldehyde 3-phosphate reductase